MFYYTVNKNIIAGNFKDITKPLVCLSKGDKIVTNGDILYYRHNNVIEAVVDDKIIHIKLSDIIKPNTLTPDIIPVPWYRSFMKELSTYKVFIVKNNLHYALSSYIDKNRILFRLGKRVNFYYVPDSIIKLFDEKNGQFDLYSGNFIIPYEYSNKDYISISKNYKDEKTYKISNNTKFKIADYIDTDVPVLQNHDMFKILLKNKFFKKLKSFEFGISNHIITNTVVDLKYKEIYVHVIDNDENNSFYSPDILMPISSHYK